MSENDDLLPDFLAECSDLIEKAHANLGELLNGGDRLELINALFRAVHTIKGGASMFHFVNTQQIAHKLENYLGSFREHPERLTDEDVLKISKIVDRIDLLLRHRDRPPAPELKAVSHSEQTENRSNVEPVKSAATTAPTIEFLRVSVERVQRNLDIISEVFLIRNQMTYLVDRFLSDFDQGHEFRQAWEGLDNALRRSIGELESVAMSMRMVPLTGLFGRMDKIVRTYVAESRKSIRFQTSGGETELDKKVFDALAEPLVHLVRNAMDHGIEPAKRRRESGKPEEGVVTLSAKVAGNEVLIEISDDGKGIDPEAIRTSAQEKGLDVSNVNDEKSALELIFLPGFSTASAVTEVSGRGVGMDVVKSSVEKLGGTISIETNVGRGSKFVIRLPLSMSVIPAIIVRLNHQFYAVSTSDIIETRRLPVSEIKWNAGEAYVRFHDRFIPCFDLEKNFPAADQRDVERRSSVFVCVVKVDDGFVAVQVGALENNTEIVVKPVPSVSPQIPYVTGISLLPTGRPVFVLSLSRFCREKFSNRGVLHEVA